MSNGIGFDADDIDPDEAEKGSGTVDCEGKYHVEIVAVHDETEVEPGQKKTPQVRFDMVVQHSVKGQSPQGSRLYHRLYFTDKEGNRKAAVKFGLRLGLLVKRGGKVIDPQTNSSRITPNLFLRAEGLHAIAEVKREEYKDESGNTKSSYRISYNEIYAINDPRVASVAKNGELAAIASGSLPQQPAASGSTRTSAPVEQDAEFADL